MTFIAAESPAMGYQSSPLKDPELKKVLQQLRSQNIELKKTIDKVTDEQT